MPRPVALSTVLGTLRKKLAPSVSAGMVMTIWRQAVGNQLALHCKPVNWQGGKLKIICDSSVWASALMSNETSIIEKIRKLTNSNVISGLHVQVRTLEPSELKLKNKRKKFPVSSEMVASSEELASHLPQELRTSFQRAYLSQKRYRGL